MALPARPAHANRQWTTQPAAAACVQRALAARLARVPGCAALAHRLHQQLGVRLVDLLDYVSVFDAGEAAAFRAAGWIDDPAQSGVLRNGSGLFPAVLTGGQAPGLGFTVEFVDEFLAAQHLDVRVDGARLHLQAFRARRRVFDDIGTGYDHTDTMVARAIGDLGSDWTCWLWLRAEREY